MYLVNKVKESWHDPLILYSEQIINRHAWFNLSYVVEYLIPSFAFSGPYKLNLLIFEEIYHKVRQRQQVVFSTCGSKFKLVLGGEYHVSSEYRAIFLFFVLSFMVDIFFCESKICQTDFMQVFAILRANQNVVQLKIVICVACEMNPLVNLEESHANHVNCLWAEAAS